jgi:acetyl-CoA carboxylase biotin carboxyl carrier protein
MHPAALAPAAAAPEAPARKETIGTPIPSPMVGTFYRAGSPEAEPFVSVGKRISPDTVLCIIEAMKVMNEIKSEVSGEILEVLVENGEPVEFGQPLFLVKTS